MELELKNLTPFPRVMNSRRNESKQSRETDTFILDSQSSSGNSVSFEDPETRERGSSQIGAFVNSLISFIGAGILG